MERTATQMSREQYLALPYARENRMEWINGEAYAMSGGTPAHAAISGNVYASLARALRGGPCRPTTGDQLVYVEMTDAYVFPDVSVICGRYRYAEQNAHAVTNPAVVVEVLSPSTADYDRGAKFEHYRRLAALQDYVLVDPETRSVTHLARQDDGWFRRDLADGALVLTAVDVALALDDFFSDLDNL